MTNAQKDRLKGLINQLVVAAEVWGEAVGQAYHDDEEEPNDGHHTRAAEELARVEVRQAEINAFIDACK